MTRMRLAPRFAHLGSRAPTWSAGGDGRAPDEMPTGMPSSRATRR